jgi:putative membrane protein
MIHSTASLSGLMAQHIVLMSVVAPLLAFTFASRAHVSLGRTLFHATAAQIALIWFWHSPPVVSAASNSPWLHLAMQISLFAVALWFWSAVAAIPDARQWRSMLALALTGKFFCLLAVLMVFAPRSLFAAGAITLSDQQTAGLIMLVACPATYVLGGIILAVRWFDTIDAGSARSPERA